LLQKQIKPVELKIQIPKKSTGKKYKQFLISDNKIKTTEPFSVYPPGRTPSILMFRGAVVPTNL